MDIGCWVDEAVAQYLVFFEFIRAFKEGGARLAIVGEVGILAGKLVFMARDLFVEVPLQGVQDKGKDLLWTPRTEDHEDITHLDGLFVLLPEPTGLEVGLREGICSPLRLFSPYEILDTITSKALGS